MLDFPSAEVIKRRRLGKRFPISQAELSAIAAASDMPVKRLLPGGHSPTFRFVWPSRHLSNDARRDPAENQRYRVTARNLLPRYRNGLSVL